MSEEEHELNRRVTPPAPPEKPLKPKDGSPWQWTEAEESSFISELEAHNKAVSSANNGDAIKPPANPPTPPPSAK